MGQQSIYIAIYLYKGSSESYFKEVSLEMCWCNFIFLFLEALCDVSLGEF